MDIDEYGALLAQSSRQTDEAINQTRRATEQTDRVMKMHEALLIRHQAMIDVLDKYERSPWPWQRMVAKAIRKDAIVRIAQIKKAGGS